MPVAATLSGMLYLGLLVARSSARPFIVSMGDNLERVLVGRSSVCTHHSASVCFHIELVSVLVETRCRRLLDLLEASIVGYGYKPIALGSLCGGGEV